MARIVITGQDGVTFEIRPNEMETLELTATPVMDPSGLEVLYHKVRIDCRAVVNPLALATNQPTIVPAVVPPPGAPPPAGWTTPTGPGDRAGLTARAILRLLGNPRPLVQYWIGPDLVMEAPERLDAAATAFAPCDPMGGPFVRHCRAYEIRGDKTIFVNVSIELATTAASKVLLSNRWRMSADIDSAGFTTRTIDGVARFRLDALAQLNAFPDDFRNLLLVPSDAAFRRTHATFTQEDDMQTYRYHVVDRQTAYGTGASSAVEKIEGTISVHSGTHVTTFKDGMHKGFDLGMGLLTGDVLGALRGLGGAVGHGLINVSLASTRISASVRVLGQAEASRRDIYNLCMQVVNLKVLTPLRTSLLTFSLENVTVTQWIGSEDQPIVEARVTLVATSPVNVQSLYSSTFAGQLMDLGTGIPAPLNFTPTTARTSWENSNNTRGGYAGNIFANFLTPVFTDTPPAPIAPPIAMNVAAEV